MQINGRKELNCEGFSLTERNQHNYNKLSTLNHITLLVGNLGLTLPSLNKISCIAWNRNKPAVIIRLRLRWHKRRLRATNFVGEQLTRTLTKPNVSSD